MASASVAPLAPDELRQLVRLGMEAALGGRPQAALGLFEALEVLRPQASFVATGQALALLAEGRSEAAVASLERARQRWPEDGELAVLLGLALRLAGRHAQARMLLATLGSAAPAAAALAEKLIELPAVTPVWLTSLGDLQ